MERVRLICPLCRWEVTRPATGSPSAVIFGGLPPVARGLAQHLEALHGWTIWHFFEWVCEVTMGEPVLSPEEELRLRATLQRVTEQAETEDERTERRRLNALWHRPNSGAAENAALNAEPGSAEGAGVTMLSLFHHPDPVGPQNAGPDSETDLSQGNGPACNPLEGATPEQIAAELRQRDQEEDT